MRRVLVIVFALALLLAGSVFVYLSRQPAETPAPSAAANPAAPSKPVTTPAVTKPATTVRPGATAVAPTPTPEAAPTMGTLIIESDVPETSVFIDRVYLGTAPVTKTDLTPGPHRLNMSVTGYEGISETIDVEPGTRTISIKFKEIRLDERVNAVHKHAIGSCSGTLRATPQGLTYETDNKGDAFTAPLTDLEAFEADYIQKNLRVKIRGGKTYNFTEAEGNADRLYLFHQAVEKVRQRLLAGRRP